MVNFPYRKLLLVIGFCASLVAQRLSAMPQLSPKDANSDPNVLQLLRQGAQAMHEGKPAEAEELFKQAVVEAPQLSDGYLGLGMSQLRVGNMDAAEQSLSKALELNPNAPDAHMFLGIAQFQMNKMDAATASVEKEVDLQPKDVQALTWLGIIELADGHPELATSPLDRAATLNPNDPNILDYRGRAHTEVARQCYQKLYQLDPDSWHVHRALADMFSAAKQPEQAIAEYKAALIEQPANPDLYEALGNEDQAAGRKDDALNAYQQELKLNPRNAIALYNIGKVYVERSDYDAGIALLRQAVEAHVLPAPAYYYIGLGLEKTEHYQEAAESLERSLDSKPADTIRQSDWYLLIRVYKKLNRMKDSEHALDEFKKLKASSGATNSTDIETP